MPDNSVYINIEDGLKRLRGNKPMYCRMLSLFLSSKSFAELEDAYAAKDAAAAGDAAHTIKGVAGNLSLTALFDITQSLMDQYRAGKFDDALFDEYRETLEETKRVVAQTIAELS